MKSCGDSGENKFINFLFLVVLCPYIGAWMLFAGELAYYLYAWNRQTMELPTSSLYR